MTDSELQAAWYRIENCFTYALNLPVAQRSAYVADQCEDNPKLQVEINALLAAHEQAGAFLKPASINYGSALNDELGTLCVMQDKRIGPYRIIREIGHGGMGSVYLARRDDGQFERQVALKLIRHEFYDNEMLKRFMNERQILAQLQHPNISTLLDGGMTENGQPYFAMEYIDGIPLTHYCRQNQSSLHDRLKLFCHICEAVSHAHDKSIVHRDIKPSNILVTADGRVKLVDFGIAKLLDSSICEEIVKTRSLHRVLTPEYAAPEQVRGGVVSTTTDVYALGVILYELLTGKLPYGTDSASATELMDKVCEEIPVKPSSCLAQYSAGRAGNKPAHNDNTQIVISNDTTLFASFRYQVHGDLDTITMTALQKEPEFRYSSVKTLLVDIRNVLAGKMIQPRAVTWRYRVGRFLARNKMNSMIVFLTTMMVIATGSIAYQQGNTAGLEANRAEAASGFLLDMLTEANPARARGRDNISIAVLDNLTHQLAGNNNLFYFSFITGDNYPDIPWQTKCFTRQVQYNRDAY